jgi:peptidoglycan/xylan/chitin deacetylase (PgdA/CDA1 family)
MIILLSIFIIFIPQQARAATEVTRSVALHDRVLHFEEGEVRIVKGQMVVPIEKMAKYLYSEIIKTADHFTINKNDTVITYNYITKETLVNELRDETNPILMMEDVLYVPIRFLGEATGFKVDYLSSILTARLSSENYPHLSNPDFIQKVIQGRKVTVPTPSDKPIVYLTFDDGPNRYTSVHIEILKEYKVKGTFFFIGQDVQTNPSIVKQAFSEGHYLGLHSMTHNKKKVYSTATSFVNEMDTESNLLKKLTGHTSTLVRAPYGSQPYVTSLMRDLLKDKGYKMWDWDVDTVDWKIKEENYEEIVRNVQIGVEKARLAKDKQIVVLLHDRPQTNKALPKIITWLQKQGYSIQRYHPEQHVSQNFWKDKAL